MCIVYVLANSCGQVEIAMLIYLWVNLGGNLSGTTTTLAIAAKNYYTDFLLYNSIIPQKQLPKSWFVCLQTIRK